MPHTTQSLPCCQPSFRRHFHACGALLLSKAFSLISLVAGETLENGVFSCFQHAKVLLMWNWKVWCLQLEKVFKKLTAGLIFVVLVFEYVLVWTYFMWSEDLWPDSFVTVIANWFLCGCAPREGAISGLWWLLRGVTCLKSDWLHCSTPCHSASVPVPAPDCKEVKNLCWSDFPGGYPGSSELLCWHAGKHRGGGAGWELPSSLSPSPSLWKY